MKPTYQVEVVTLKSQPTLIVRAEVALNALGPALVGILPRTFQHAMKSGASAAGMPFTRFLSSGPIVSIEAGVPVSARVDGAGDIAASELPAGKCVTTVHLGPYEGLPAAHEALLAWAKESGATPGAFSWEQYVTDPSTEPDPQLWKTQVYLSLR